MNATNQYLHETLTIMGKPSFLIVGCERCGTTSLYANICQHPKIFPAYKKEIEFFDRYYDRGIDWYHQQFNHNNGRITGEATPTYFWNPAVPGRIRAYNPDMKIIVITRDKDKAIQSRYNQQITRGVEKLSLEDALRFERIRIEGEMRRVLSLPYTYYPTMFSDYAYAERYNYMVHFFEWRDFDLLCVTLEDLIKWPDDVMKTVFSHVGVDYHQGQWKHLNKAINPVTDDLCVE